jgi:transposase
LLGVEQWAEIGRMSHVERLSQREIHRRTGVHRDTIRRALASPEPPSYGPRAKRPSKLDAFVGAVAELLVGEPTLSGVRIREELEGLGYVGGKTILYDLLRELRPRFLPPPRSFQRTRYRPGELAQFDLCEPRSEIAVGWGQTRRGYVVTCELPYSRAFAGALVFSKEFSDIAYGMARCLARLGALPDRLVWDREGAIAPRGRPTEAFLAFCGRFALGWVILDAGDCQAKGASSAATACCTQTSRPAAGSRTSIGLLLPPHFRFMLKCEKRQRLPRPSLDFSRGPGSAKGAVWGAGLV